MCGCQQEEQLKIEQVHKFNYLGVVLTDDGNVIPEFEGPLK